MEKWKSNNTIKISTNGISRENLLATILSFILLSSSFSFHEVYSDEFNFEDISNLSDTDSGFSQSAQISTVGSNVYVVWEEDSTDVFFSVSTDNGETFSEPVSISTPDSGFSSLPQISTVGSNVYVVWQEQSTDGADVFFSVSTDNGETFSEPVSISTPDSGFSSLPQISTVGSNVYVVWQEQSIDGTDIFFSVSPNNGETFSEPVNLSNIDSGFSELPQIAAVESNVYVVWQDDGPGEYDIFFTASTNSGADFDSYINLSESDASSEFPQIATVGSNVYVVWQDFDLEALDIFFAASPNNGEAFSEPVNLSLTDSGFSELPQIAAVESNVYVVWQDDFLGQYEIFFSISTDNGELFDEAVNLSDNDGMSRSPQLEKSGQNIYVVWQDDTPGQNEVFFIASTDEGFSFSTIVQVSDVDNISEIPKIAVLGTDCHIVWEDSSLGIADIFYRGCSQVMQEINFDFSQYKLSDTANITIIDSSSAGLGFISADVSTSPSGGNIPSFVLAESDTNPGVFTGQLTFTSADSSSTAVHAKAGDIITVTLGEISNSASIYPIIVEFDNTIYNLGQSALIQVTDQNSNKNIDAIEEISITVTSTTDLFGIPLILIETGTDTGIFKNKKLIFMQGDYRFPINSNIKISQEENIGGLDTNNFVDTISVDITSRDPFDALPVEEIPSFPLTETGGSTGLFEGTFTITSGPTSSNTIHAKEGDIVSVTYFGATTNGLVIPNPNENVGAIQAAIGDKIIASYSEESAEVFIFPGSGGGKAGGGVIRPGLVLNTILGIFGGGSGANSPPSFGQSSFAIISGGEEGFGGILNDNNVNTLEETKTFNVGEKAVLRFDFTEGGGIGKIEHIGLYTNVRDGQKRQDSDAYIFYDPLKSPQVTLHDPNGLFSEANFDLLQKDATNFILKFELTFAKSMAKSDLILESWNLQKWSTINKIPNAIEVVSSGLIQQTASKPIVDTFVEDVVNDQVIPVWVKTNAKWWSDDTIDNENFISGIEYLVNEGIIKVTLPDITDNTSISEVQPWIKNTAGWWADDMISDDEFLAAIEWLISNNIIQVV